MSKSLRTTTDRFTSLPDDVAHKVVSSLSLEDVSRLSVVSRRCRQLCISMPSLNVDVRPYLQDATKRTRLMNYVERLFSLRRGVSTHRLCIGWFLDSSVNDKGGGEEEYRILSWLHNAVTCNVKWLVLYLRLKRGSAFSLPPCLIHSTSLESLTACVSINSILEFPSYSTIELSSLKTLDLWGVRIDESFGNWVSTCCKFLRSLYLKQIKETESIAINSSSITKLCITSMDYKLCHLQVSAWILEKMSLWWEFDSANNRTLQLSVPMLRMFVWKGNILRLPLTENLAALKSSASILFRSASTLTSQNLIRFYCDFRNLNHPIPNLFDKHSQVSYITL
ncbi:F-box domain containing protein [Trema orientale]|uniref:F-box domain containing protein n=1 Tax=Trema orientale TaxID=63057 RepID=A0A2P5E679_TREOI|nr:F-box domain containing protein [Trema orientale]